MALQPISLSNSIWRSSARVLKRRAERAEIVMIADAVQRNARSVQQKAIVRRELNRADAERRFVAVDDLPVDANTW